MIKFSVYYHEHEATDTALMSIIRYARDNELFVWQVEDTSDRFFLYESQAKTRCVTAWLVTRSELIVMQRQEDAVDDEIPF